MSVYVLLVKRVDSFIMAVQKHVFKLSHINNYFKDEMKLVQKGENAVESGHVINMKYNDAKKVIHGTVHASMKDRIYSVEIFLDEDRNIVSTTCTCPNGQLSCHHVAALGLFAHYNISSTDVACSWSAPKPSKAAESIKSVPELCPPIRQYKASQRLATNNEVGALRERLESYGGAVGFTWLLAPKLMAKEQSIVENVAEIIFSSEFQNDPNKNNYFEKKMCLPAEKVIELFNKTVGQSKSPLWLVTKKLRLTASLFGVVLGACKRNRYPDSLYKKLTGSYNLEGVKAVEWGREHERDAITAFTTAKGLCVVPAGLWLHPCGYLGASPDGLVGEDALIEIKCPFKYRDTNLMEALSKEKYICSFDVENQRFKINEDHVYFHQMQGQLHILKKKICYLVLWTPQVVAIIEVDRQENWAENIDVLKNFYINKFIPHILASDVIKE